MYIGRLAAVFLLFVSFWIVFPYEALAQEQVLFRFDGNDGSAPFAPLIFDSSGNLYGTTQGGGITGNGTVFQLVPAGGGTWTQNILYEFQGGSDGAVPYGALAIDAAGNLYGTTQEGGSASSYCYDLGCGTVFELSRSGNTWTETVIYRFQGGSDGDAPLAGVAIDRAGNLYGTTNDGGACLVEGGTAFQLTHTNNGWVKSIIHNFCQTTGSSPAYGTMLFDRAGNLYGVAYGGGGSNASGVVYRLNRLGANSWAYTILHQFTDDEGFVGFTNLYMDSHGNLYGVGDGGVYDAGIVWQLVPTGANGYHLNVIYNLQGGSDGDGPFSAPVFSTDGKLYGTTYNGGIDDLGVVYQLTPLGNGQWSGDVLYRFQPTGADPYNVVAPFITDPAENLYGTSPKGCYQVEGGCRGFGCGCVYQIVP